MNISDFNKMEREKKTFSNENATQMVILIQQIWLPW
jgi:hypothetical protein